MGETVMEPVYDCTHSGVIAAGQREMSLMFTKMPSNAHVPSIVYFIFYYYFF